MLHLLKAVKHAECWVGTAALQSDNSNKLVEGCDLSSRSSHVLGFIAATCEAWLLYSCSCLRSAMTLWSQFAVWSGGGAEKQADRQVRTQETEAECNRGRTTCHPASGGLSGSSRSEGPGSLPVDLACGFWWVESRKRRTHELKKTRANKRIYFHSNTAWVNASSAAQQNFEEWRQLRAVTSSPPLTSAWSAAWGSRCALDSPPPPLPRGTGGPSPSSPWPQSVGWIPPLQTGCWPEKASWLSRSMTNIRLDSPDGMWFIKKTKTQQKKAEENSGSPSGFESALWSLRPHQTRRQGGGKSWFHAHRSHPES